MYPKREFTLFLEELAKSEPQIQVVLYTDLAGVVKGVLKRNTTSEPTSHVDQLHAFLGCAIVQSYVEMGMNYALKKLRTVMVEYQHGTLLLAPTCSGVLMVLADLGANLGFIRHKLVRIKEKVRKLESTLETPQLPPLTEIREDNGTKKRNSSIIEVRHQIKEPVDEKELLKKALQALDNI
ncbi:MAG: hypothetical protein ACE5R6_12505 [Candidatus Heimdallarchaeota archaeon]